MPDEIQEIIDVYNKLIRSIDGEATKSKGRTYGGIVRAAKGKLVEDIAKTLISIAWQKLKKPPTQLKMVSRQIKIPIRQEYIEKLRDEEVKEYIRKNIKDYYYPYKPDILVAIEDKIILAVECKSYTENAMLKRILVDATLLKTQYPDIKFLLFQLESQLGGDFSELKDITYGSPSTHTLLSYFDIDLHIITLLAGERRIDQPIHKEKFFKPLERKNLEKAIKIIAGILEEVRLTGLTF
ncbi:MAG: restriction endonuclease [candidate division WOR-3 bacterium]